MSLALNSRLLIYSCQQPIMFQFFTISEANDLLPDIIKKYEYVMAKRDDVQKIEHSIQTSMIADKSLQGYVEMKQQLNTAITKLYESIEILEDTGIVIKSLEQGLLDFPSKRFNDEIWLCWKYGETEVKFWHELDSGFMGRKPISVSDESLV